MLSRLSLILALICLLSGFASCSDVDGNSVEIDEWGPISVTGGYPLTLLPSSRLVIQGGPFPDASFGVLTLNIDGVFQGGGQSVSVRESRLATWIDAGHMEISIPPDLYQRLAGGAMQSGTLSARFWVEAVSSRTQRIYASEEIPVNVQLVTALTPTLDSVSTGNVYHFESPITFDAGDLLLDNEEGVTVAVLSGCFLPYGATGTCEASGTTMSDVELPLTALDPVTRRGGSFGIPVSVFGVEPGTFEGTLTLRNRHQGDVNVDSQTLAFTVDLIETEITRVVTSETSLGGYIVLQGEGFALQGDQCGTTLSFDGEFTHAQGGADPFSLILIPEVVSSSEIRYILEEGADFGATLDLRKVDGILDGTVTPQVCCGAQCQEGLPFPVSVGIGPVKQVVQLVFQDSYVAALSRFGLQGAQLEIRDSMVDVINTIYQGINVEIRTEAVEDYALYSVVEIHGFDPNNLGLMGYDNTVGKDVGNLRLYDTLGGVNSHTQQDGYPGYGGVFLESYFGFSKCPPEGISSIDLATGIFDLIFDPLRPDRGGTAVSASEISSIIQPTDLTICLEESGSRAVEISCAVAVLARMVGSTIAHELGHSFGLAEPGSPDVFHNLGEQPYRLMDSGGLRPFEERTGLLGEGIEKFCISNFQYLLSIMPDPGHTDDGQERPGC